MVGKKDREREMEGEREGEYWRRERLGDGEEDIQV